MSRRRDNLVRGHALSRVALTMNITPGIWARVRLHPDCPGDMRPPRRDHTPKRPGRLAGALVRPGARRMQRNEVQHPVGTGAGRQVAPPARPDRGGAGPAGRSFAWADSSPRAGPLLQPEPPDRRDQPGRCQSDHHATEQRVGNDSAAIADPALPKLGAT